MTQKNGDSRCGGVNKSGRPCQAAATAGGLCFFHANPNKASELGRVGGRANRRVSGAPLDPLPRLNTVTAVRDTVARLIEDVYSGKLSPRIAAGLAPLLNLQLRAIDTSDIEQRLEALGKVSGMPAQERLDGRGRDVSYDAGTSPANGQQSPKASDKA